MPKLAAVTSQADPPSPARRNLADAITAKSAIDKALGVAVTAVNAASSLVAQEATVRAEVDAMNRRNAEIVSEWIKSGGEGQPQIVEPFELRAIQDGLDTAIATAAAARIALPALQAKMDAARAAADAARYEVQQAVRAVLVDEANAIDTEIMELFDRATALRARLYGLGNYAMRLPQSAPLVASIRRLVERYVSEPTDAAVLVHQDQWRALAERLAADPAATIQPE